MAPPLLILRDIRLGFGGPALLDGAELMVSEGDRLCLVGRNGSGKSTLMKIAAGLAEPGSGEVFIQPGATVRYLAQEPDLGDFATTLGYVEAGLGPGDDAHRARVLLERLGIDGDADPNLLSGGEARRAGLARVLAPMPDILLLDEPTNHLDLPAIEWLEGEIGAMRSACVLVSHDRRFLETLSRETVWLSGGKTRRMARGFKGFEAWRDEMEEQEEKDRHKLDRKLAAEADWLHKGVTARRKRNQGRLRALYALRAKRREQRGPVGVVNFPEMKAGGTEAEMSGKLVAEAKNVSKSFDGRAVVHEYSTRIQRGDRIGIVGPNGAGKTTLLNMLTGALAPDVGTVRLGVNLQMVTLDQRRENLDPDSTLSEALTGGRGETVSVAGMARHVIGYMKDFLFAPEQARTPVRMLSGGERARLMLARALARPSNLLVLDEPTNDLDLETLDLLQEMLADYPGTVLLVSHDRDFLDRVVTSVIASEERGRWIEYAGGYSDMIAQRAAAPPASAATPRAKPKIPKPATAAPRRAQKPRLSFNEKHALETLPARMEALTADIARYETTFADSNLYSTDPSAYENAAEALRHAQAELARAEEEWLSLELKRESIEGE